MRTFDIFERVHPQNIGNFVGNFTIPRTLSSKLHINTKICRKFPTNIGKFCGKFPTKLRYHELLAANCTSTLTFVGNLLQILGSFVGNFLQNYDTTNFKQQTRYTSTKKSVGNSLQILESSYKITIPPTFSSKLHINTNICRKFSTKLCALYELLQIG